MRVDVEKQTGPQLYSCKFPFIDGVGSVLESVWQKMAARQQMWSNRKD